VPEDSGPSRPGDGRSPLEGIGIDAATLAERTVFGVLGIEAVELGPERVVMRVPVTHRVHQPYGILHGGVSALLAESAASIGAGLAAPPGHHVVGIELNASHLRPMRSGVLTAVATPIRAGRTIQVWDVALSDDAGRAICRARCTLAVRRAPSGRDSLQPE
jgi:1,4-dihydroxy-2-naphthoyl-CoA hydrolase